jgi:hypothetical protein
MCDNFDVHVLYSQHQKSTICTFFFNLIVLVDDLDPFDFVLIVLVDGFEPLSFYFQCLWSIALILYMWIFSL